MPEEAASTDVIEDRRVYYPQPGPQESAIQARYFVDELFYGGARGGGKSYYLLLDFAMDIDQHGRNWNGILFRRTYAQLDELIRMSKEIYGDVYPDAEYKIGANTWEFENGSTLKFRYLDKDEDSESYRGHSYQWIAWDELDQWPTDTAYKKIKATLRSGIAGVPKRIRATGNPGGPGHNWIKKRFIDLTPAGYELVIDEETEEKRMFIPSKVQDNKILMESDPGYINRIKAATEGNEQLERAWLLGSWDVFFGSFFDSFDMKIHKVDPFEICPGGIIPPHWRLEGALDYGERSPTAFGLFATSEEGVSYLVAEYYKGGLWVDEHAANIKELIATCPWTRGRQPERIWADGHIFHVRSAAGDTSGKRFVSDNLRHGIGVTLKKSNKDRITGWRFLKNCLAWKKNNDTGEFVRKPSLYYFPDCTEFERAMRVARFVGGDDGRVDDLDQKPNDDHIPDMVRYYVMGSRSGRERNEEPKPDGITFNDLMARANQKRLGIARGQVSFTVPTPDPISKPATDHYFRCLTCSNTFKHEFIKCKSCGSSIVEKVNIRNGRDLPNRRTDEAGVLAI